ncbi:MAG TPA: hypothetical protein VMY34_05905 [Acidimicrobiales bacterium]|nr:hypothetical protein [Acidimicrobiales bacterium]
MREQADVLADAIVAAIPGWVVECVAAIAGAWETAGGELPEEMVSRATAAGRDAQIGVGRELAVLFAADVDDQRTTPLAIVRDATRYATAVLRDAGVPPIERSAFDEERFPDDPYGLTPASLADLDESLGSLGLAWGAAKAFEHKQRHRGAG